MTMTKERSAIHGTAQQRAELVAALRQLATEYRSRARQPRDLSDRLNRHQLLELAEGAEEFANASAARAQFAACDSHNSNE